MNKFFKLILATCIVCFVFACEDDENDPVTKEQYIQFLTNGSEKSWKIDRIIDPDGNNIKKDCQDDDVLVFKKENQEFSFMYNQKCFPESTDDFGTWEISDDLGILTFYGSAAILTLNQEELIIMYGSYDNRKVTGRSDYVFTAIE
ncbi:hypothetical protein LVD15_11760 [Fulvivirga maritima]|uniref:lipocalin family protein n=1 Tax=Fulvivirga maritima TaxID=2904247 RepID=UPI001F25446B|nr:lipocalin family protein [Fulvivirga maritima]UII29071.1 hypothetical protein LVD15_11760 [Fulvivirga maritima]